MTKHEFMYEHDPSSCLYLVSTYMKINGMLNVDNEEIKEESARSFFV